MADDMADVMADDQDFKQGMLVGETFSEILVEGQKSGDSMFCGSSLEKLAKAGHSILIWGHVKNINSLTAAMS